MHGFCCKGLQLALRVQRCRLGLGQGPEDAQQGHEEHGDAQCLVQREEPCLAGQLLGRVIGQIIGDGPQGDDRQDQQGREPVKAARDAAISGIGVGTGHSGSPVKRGAPISKGL